MKGVCVGLAKWVRGQLVSAGCSMQWRRAPPAQLQHRGKRSGAAPAFCAAGAMQAHHVRQESPHNHTRAQTCTHLRRLAVNHPAVAALVRQDASIPPFHCRDRLKRRRRLGSLSLQRRKGGASAAGWARG